MRRLLLGAVVAAALVAPQLAGAALVVARESGAPPTDLVQTGVLLLTLCVAFLAAAFVTGRLLPASRSGCREEAAAWLAAAGWFLLQWFLFETFFRRVQV